MARYAILRLQEDPKTGELIFDIGYESDASSLPVEHESEHRKLAVGVVGAEAVKGSSRVAPQHSSSNGDNGGGNLTNKKSVGQGS